MSLATHPSLRRSISTFQRAVGSGEFALLLGAGVDLALALEGGTTTPSWGKLVAALRPFGQASGAGPDEISRLAEEWPTEVALAARMRLGDRNFARLIDRKINPSLSRRTAHDFSAALAALAIHTNLIVTSNYSSLIERALRQHIRPKRRLVVLDREELATFHFPAPEPVPSTIFLIHIHGRCSDRSFPILDAWGYDVVMRNDPDYAAFLQGLFARRHILTIGTSWRDPPLRNAAAFVNSTRPYLHRAHLAMFFDHDDASRAAKNRPAAVYRAWAGAMHAAYGVTSVVVGPDEQRDLVNRLAGLRLSGPTNDDAKSIADFLDLSGDYESPVQQTWMTGNSRSSDAICSHLDEIEATARMSTRTGTVANWVIAARIERHHRHYRYLYDPAHQERRLCFWSVLRDKLPEARQWDRIDPRLRLDFLLGHFELGAGSNPALRRLRTGDPLFDERLVLGRELWRKRRERAGDKASLASIERLAHRLLDLGWESMAAKAFTDRAHNLAQRCNATSCREDEAAARLIVAEAERAEKLARVAGCFRRRIKADALAAIWSADPVAGRHRLLRALRATEERSALEPAMYGVIAVGLVICHARSLLAHGRGRMSMTWFARESSSLLAEAGLSSRYISPQTRAFWCRLAPAYVAQFLR